MNYLRVKRFIAGLGIAVMLVTNTVSHLAPVSVFAAEEEQEERSSSLRNSRRRSRRQSSRRKSSSPRSRSPQNRFRKRSFPGSRRKGS